MLGPAVEFQVALDGNYATADMEMDVVSVGKGGKALLGPADGVFALTARVFKLQGWD